MSPLEQLSLRLVDARRLLEIHEQATGAGAGRRRNVDVLNRSAMLLTIAAWEGFSEDVVRVSGTRISRRISGPNGLPESITRPFMFWYFEENQLHKASDTSKQAMFTLAGDGWRYHYRRYIERKVDDLNTPSFGRLKKLASQTVGIADIGENWHSGRFDKDYYVGRLTAALDIRHEVAHGTRGDVTVGKGTARDAIALVERLARWVADAIAANERALALGDTDIE